MILDLLISLRGYAGGGEEAIEPPFGKYYVMGNNNALTISPRGRSFMGTNLTNGADNNPGGVFNNYKYSIQGQRWHYTITLPSTAVAVKSGKQPTTNNLEEIGNNKHVLLTAVAIKAFGEVYTLKNDVNNLGGVVIQTVKSDGTIQSTKYDIGTRVPYQVISVTSADKSAKDDMTVSGTH